MGVPGGGGGDGPTTRICSCAVLQDSARGSVSDGGGAEGGTYSMVMGKPALGRVSIGV